MTANRIEDQQTDRTPLVGASWLSHPRNLAAICLSLLLSSCAVKTETETSSTKNGNTDQSADTGDTPYFGWMEIYYVNSSGSTGNSAGQRVSPASFQSRFSRSQFATASLETGINTDQYQSHATQSCSEIPSAQQSTCIDLLKRMHALCAKTLMNLQKGDSSQHPSDKLACKMWVLSSGRTARSSCTELDDIPTGEIEFKESNRVTAKLRFVDVPLGGGTLAQDPPSCSEAWSRCGQWKEEKPSQRNCEIQGFGVYKMR